MMTMAAPTAALRPITSATAARLITIMIIIITIRVIVITMTTTIARTILK